MTTTSTTTITLHVPTADMFSAVDTTNAPDTRIAALERIQVRVIEACERAAMEVIYEERMRRREARR